MPATISGTAELRIGDQPILHAKSVTCSHGDAVVISDTPVQDASEQGWEWDGLRWLCPSCVARLGHGVRDV